MSLDPPTLLDELRVLATTLATLAIPGWALLSSGPGWRRLPALAAWATALALGIAFYPVLFALAGAVAPALALSRGVLLGVLAASLVLAGWNLRRDPLAPLRFVRLEQIGVLVVLATLATRAWVAHLEPFPAWSDSLHHVILTELTAGAGRLPSTMEPYFPIPLGRYHLGLYALTGAVQTLAGVPAHLAVTWVAQVLSGLCGLGVYLVLDRYVGRVPAVIGAICAGLLSQQPAFYVNWGRFTQLAAQTILLPAWLMVDQALRGVARPDPAGLRRPALVASAAAACLLVGGVFLLHLRVAIFLTLLLALTFAAHVWRARREPRLLRRLVVAGGVLLAGALLLGGPRLLRAIVEYGQGHWAALHFQGGLFAGGGDGARLLGDPEYFAVPWESLTYLFADGVSIAVVLLLAAIALWCRSRLAWLFVAWTVLLLALGEAHRLQVPLLNVTNLGAVLIMLYLPASVLVGAGLASLLGWTRAGAVAQTALLVAFLVLGAFGARERVVRLEPSRFFVTPADLRAMRWLAENAPQRTLVAVRTSFWLPNAPHGIDAGYWIPYLTGRRTTVGPMISNLSPQYTNGMVRLSKQLQAALADDAQMPRLWGAGVRYLYLGARGDPAEAARLAQSPHVALRYADGGVFIFEVDPSAVANDRPGGRGGG